MIVSLNKITEKIKNLFCVNTKLFCTKLKYITNITYLTLFGKSFFTIIVYFIKINP